MPFDGYTAVLVIWTTALLCALCETVQHYRHWRRKSDFQIWLRRPGRVPVSGGRRVAKNWVNNAIFHLGLRILLITLASERLILQLSIPVSDRGTFGNSPLQFGLALTFFIILLWVSRWTRTINRYDSSINGEDTNAGC